MLRSCISFSKITLESDSTVFLWGRLEMWNLFPVDAPGCKTIVQTLFMEDDELLPVTDFEDVLVTVFFLLRKNPKAEFWTTYQVRRYDCSSVGVSVCGRKPSPLWSPHEPQTQPVWCQWSESGIRLKNVLLKMIIIIQNYHLNHFNVFRYFK